MLNGSLIKSESSMPTELFIGNWEMSFSRTAVLTEDGSSPYESYIKITTDTKIIYLKLDYDYKEYELENIAQEIAEVFNRDRDTYPSQN